LDALISPYHPLPGEGGDLTFENQIPHSWGMKLDQIPTIPSIPGRGIVGLIGAVCVNT